MKTREWNPASLRFTATRMEDGGWNTRSVLECGGKRSATPLSDAAGTVEKLRRRFAPVFAALRLGRLPEQSIIFTVLVLLLSTLIFQPSTASAQPYSIDWYKIAGGGGTSTGGVYAVSGTIGQHDAGGPMTGGNYSLTGGFWALISVVQTPGAPLLTITHSGNSVIVSWPNTGSYTLQQNSNLAASAGWTTSGYTVTPSNGTNSITITLPTGNLFFRLSQ
jgi:hypothetical protein